MIKADAKLPALMSAITCPACGFSQQETMPVNACIYFYPCSHCETLLKPNPGDCCVFCSYGTVACPPKQMDHECCGG
ncbi:MAG: hypothetical protein CTY34_12060 [Methylobacter sp.]|nr:MAG: hypothetical protein CTY34_12060 [Methylobacter sp.]PPD02970.1 MAG: hypothetical protein CTY29_11250 [Methylobacter sp.]PPD23068.1 MAG: hypothetical protein CTY24_05665 [Methylobacter sp.]PPD33859.1 MAG: hypothetical protein CTY18_09255 [Methylomonas sp.]